MYVSLCVCGVYLSEVCVLTCFTHHGGQQLGDDRPSLPHLTLFTVREVGDHPGDTPGTGSPARIHHDQQLHDGSVHIPGDRDRERYTMMVVITSLETERDIHHDGSVHIPGDRERYTP